MVVSLDYALSNTIRTTVTDLVIRPPGVPRTSTSDLYRADVDYRVVDNRGVPPRLPSDFRAGKVGALCHDTRCFKSMCVWVFMCGCSCVGVLMCVCVCVCVCTFVCTCVRIFFCNLLFTHTSCNTS